MPTLSATREIFSPGVMQPRALRREGLAARVAPFAVPLALGFCVLPGAQPAEDAPTSGILLLVAAVVALVFMVTIFFAPWEKLPRSAEAIPPLSIVLIVYLLREGSGLSYQVFAPLLLLPLFWLALYGTRGELLLAFVFITGIGFLSNVTHGANDTTFRFQLLAALISPIVCFTTQSLVQCVRSQAEQLEALACTDALTCIPNRRAWDDELARALARGARRREDLCIAVLDLDFFKKYNDAHGHQAGDELLRDVAKNWRHALREGDFLARYGGEEFAVLLPMCALEEAMTVLERVCAVVPQGETCSVGVASWDGKEPAPELVERADAALYAAKAAGRNRIHPSTCELTVVAAPTIIAKP